MPHKPDVEVMHAGDWTGYCRTCRRRCNWVTRAPAGQTWDAGPASGNGHWRHNPAPHSKVRYRK